MDRTDILNDYVTDMGAVEKHIHDAVERQLGSDETQKYPDAVRVLSTLRSTLQGHIRALEAYNERTEDGGVKEAVKDAVAGALGVAAGFYDQIRGTDKVSRMVRDSYTATSLAAISYHNALHDGAGPEGRGPRDPRAPEPQGAHADPRRPLEGGLLGRREGAHERGPRDRPDGRRRGRPGDAGGVEPRERELAPPLSLYRGPLREGRPLLFARPAGGGRPPAAGRAPPIRPPVERSDGRTDCPP